ncbi:hypothetical protein FRB96_008355 [Tulasnella sp. 330]|nr:hypothetical protein FRB96_008355 [Tulasnella sp. 330]KAG8884765.1 hypothetical protein FRB97_003286 [Tulasnella sp. 331]KAG8889866.1 hypothetical protein FRB98_002220 [Tulasnella sp. 332]
MPPIPKTAFHIREAKEEDIPVILQMIKDLATYEKEPESAKATPELLKVNIFTQKHASTLLAFTGTESNPGEAVGMALYFFNFSTWTGRPGLYLEDLFVSEQYRKLGIGKAFFGALAKVAQENNCARMDWSVLKWNTPSIQFYEKVLGAKGMDEWEGMRLEETGIEALKKFALTG